MNTFTIENEDGSRLIIETTYVVAGKSRLGPEYGVVKPLPEAQTVCMIRDAINENKLKVSSK